jgi:hypothetical protein
LTGHECSQGCLCSVDSCSNGGLSNHHLIGDNVLGSPDHLKSGLVGSLLDFLEVPVELIHSLFDLRNNLLIEVLLVKDVLLSIDDVGNLSSQIKPGNLKIIVDFGKIGLSFGGNRCEAICHISGDFGE